MNLCGEWGELTVPKGVIEVKDPVSFGESSALRDLVVLPEQTCRRSCPGVVLNGMAEPNEAGLCR